MPPRLRPLTATCAIRFPPSKRLGRFCLSARLFTTSPNHHGKRQDRLDRYTQSRKVAHELAAQSRQKPEEEAPSDPVRGITTPFAKLLEEPQGKTQSPPTGELVNYMLSAAELEKQLIVSKNLSSNSISPSPSTLSTLDPEVVETQAKTAELHESNHDRAAEAVKRIFRLESGSSKDRYKYNVQRCVNTFGRHNTDKALPSRSGGPVEEKFRAGPDTGSSEVQIAILTAKIRTLANFLDGRGRKDIANKRSLQLLVHKRQKLLKYLRKRERGGPRWQNCISTLGLTEATWKGEIAL